MCQVLIFISLSQIQMKKIFQIVTIICLTLSFLSCKNSEKSDTNLKDEVANPTEKKDLKEEVPQPDPATAKSIAAGESVYTQNCAVCHQKNGGGVPNLNPPLKGADYALGDKKPLINLLLKGSSEVPIKVNGQTYSNVMPSFSSLDDAQIANVLTYIRNSFSNNASAVEVSTVKEIRSTSD
ncbi:MAG TPA: cytochrome c [Leeuwenhoekiella sp.]|nr:cytochrome c [Leeuwenhoekiella sp.]